MKPQHIVLIIITSLILLLFLTRLISPREIDDISPEILCEEEYIQKSNILWVIPKFNGKLISDDKEWCNSILALNKTLGLHGITHQYEEFNDDITQKQLNEAIKIFKECFGFKPTMFKPPQLKINSNNKKLIKNNDLKLKLYFNQITHKVYHCSDTGRFSNRLIDLF